jgi:hypothetical protein
LRHPFVTFRTILLAAALGACGSSPLLETIETSEPPAPDTRPGGGGQMVVRAPTLAPGELLTQSDTTKFVRGRILDVSTDRLYFVARPNVPPLPDVVVLRAIGTESVELLDVRLLDNNDSAFGVDAARHFEVMLVPGLYTILPGQSLEVEVRFRADTTELKNAILELRTTAENAPTIYVALTGKVISL